MKAQSVHHNRVVTHTSRSPLRDLQPKTMPRVLLLVCFALGWSEALTVSRRGCLEQVASVAAAGSLVQPAIAAQQPGPDLRFVDSPVTGIKYADAKLGTGQPITEKGAPVTIDYVMSTTGARYGTKIFSTADTNVPYRFKLGDGSTIRGIELAIAGGEGIEPMRPGGIRRVIIPAKLGYESLAQPLAGLQYQDCQEGRGVGPIPPVEAGTTGEYYQRFKNIYCNANRPYQPDLVMDIKLYGKR